MPERLCLSCRAVKPLSDFQSKGKYGPDAHCKPCRREKDRLDYVAKLSPDARERYEWRKAATPEQRVAKQREAAKQRYRDNLTAERCAYLDYLKTLSLDDRQALQGLVYREGEFNPERWEALRARRDETEEQRQARIKASKATYWRALRFRKKRLVIGLKRQPCKDCGGAFPPEAMDFDHLRDKVKNIGEMIQTGSTGALLAEVAKCDLVCANCHRIRTARRRLGLPVILPPPEYEI